MDLRGYTNAGDSKRRPDEKIWRENEHMGRILDDKVKELDRHKERLGKKLKKEQERFAVQHLNITNSTDARATRRKKISLTIEPYKFTQTNDGGNDGERFSYHGGSKNRARQNRSASVSDIGMIRERNNSLAKPDLLLPPIMKSKLQLSTQDVRSLANIPDEDAEESQEKTQQTTRNKPKPEASNQEVSIKRAARRAQSLNSEDVYSSHLRNTQKFEDHSNKDLSVNESTTSKIAENGQRFMKHEGEHANKLISNTASNEVSESPIFTPATKQKPNDKGYRFNNRRKLGSMCCGSEPLDHTRMAKLTPIDPHRVASLHGSQAYENGTTRSRTSSSTVSGEDEGSSGALSSGFGSISRVDMVKNMDKKRQVELEHQIAFLPPTNRMFNDSESDPSNDRTLNESDSRRMSIAKNRWLQAYSTAKQNFYGQNKTERGARMSISENRKETQENCAKDPRLLSLVSMLHKCKSLAKETESKFGNDLI